MSNEDWLTSPFEKTSFTLSLILGFRVSKFFYLPSGILPISISTEARAWTDLVGKRVETTFHARLPPE